MLVVLRTIIYSIWGLDVKEICSYDGLHQLSSQNLAAFGSVCLCKVYMNVYHFCAIMFNILSLQPESVFCKNKIITCMHIGPLWYILNNYVKMLRKAVKLLQETKSVHIDMYPTVSIKEGVGQHNFWHGLATTICILLCCKWINPSTFFLFQGIKQPNSHWHN